MMRLWFPVPLIYCNLVFLSPEDRGASCKLLNLALIAPLNALKSRNIVFGSSNSLFIFVEIVWSNYNISKGRSKFLNPDVKIIFSWQFHQ